MSKIEILAPVGSEEMLHAAVFSGADAVYLGFSGFNARTSAGNFDADSLKELEEKGYTLPEYAFVVECGGATSGESGVLEVY